jgi:fructose-bisphosphate aldolase class II
MTNAECRALPPDQLARGRAAVERTVCDKLENFLHSAGKAEGFSF